MSLIIASKWGLTVHRLSRADTEDIFTVLAAQMIDKRKNSSMIRKDERVIRARIEYTFSREEFVAIGVLKDGDLIGVALCNDRENQPWIGHMTVLKEYRKTKAFILLSYYISNILYKDKVIRLDTDIFTGFRSVLTILPEQIGGQAISRETAERLRKIVEDN